jgi:signal peptidase I
MRQKRNSLIIYASIAFTVICLSVVFLLNFNIVFVDGNSMQPTYKDKQILVASKNKHIKNNDIVVFEKDGEIRIKRVIAIPSDTIKLIGNEIYKNDVRLQPYTYEGDDLTIILGDDEYFVIGDNYQNSIDSRVHGAIKRKQIIGVVVMA